MVAPAIDGFVRKAENFYAARLRALLESAHHDEFVAIEPESGDYFLGKSLSQAAQAARRVYANRPTHIMRVGHRAALHFGMQIR